MSSPLGIRVGPPRVGESAVGTSRGASESRRSAIQVPMWSPCLGAHRCVRRRRIQRVEKSSLAVAGLDPMGVRGSPRGRGVAQRPESRASDARPPGMCHTRTGGAPRSEIQAGSTAGGPDRAVRQPMPANSDRRAGWARAGARSSAPVASVWRHGLRRLTRSAAEKGGREAAGACVGQVRGARGAAPPFRP